MPANTRRSNIIGSIACVLVALLSLGFGVSKGMQVQRLESIGIPANAVVTRLHRGAKNSKFAVVVFKTQADVDIEARSIAQMFVIRHETGDRVTVLYDPSNPEIVMIDNGMWNWDQPAFGILGGLLLLGLAVLILRSLPKPTPPTDV